MSKREKITSLIILGEIIAHNHSTSVSNASKRGVRDMRGIGSWTKDFDKWVGDVKIASMRHFADHPLIDELNNAIAQKEYRVILGLLESINSDEEYFINASTVKYEEDSPMSNNKAIDPKKVFIVHGHDEEAIAKTENFVRKMGLNPIILHDQASMGKTIIEKIEAYTDVGFAIVLYTPCDETKNGQFRARQNVVIEHGYLMSKIGRDRVIPLVKGAVETPGDIAGVVYVRMDNGKEWERQLVKELIAAGYNADANRI